MLFLIFCSTNLVSTCLVPLIDRWLLQLQASYPLSFPIIPLILGNKDPAMLLPCFLLANFYLGSHCLKLLTLSSLNKTAPKKEGAIDSG